VTDITKNLTELVGNRGFLNNKFISGDSNIVDGVVDPNEAVTGQWHVEVLQLAQKPGALSNGFPDRDTSEMGVGYIKFNTPDGVKEVYISGNNSTMDSVAQQINNANIGIRATVINDRSDKSAPFKLLVTGLQPGDDNQVEFPTVYMLDGDEDLYFDNAKKAQNAKVKLDGFEFELPDNVTKDLIPGVTVDLKQTAPGREIRVTVKEDLEVISGKVKTFVDTYNAALSFIQGQAKLSKGNDGKERLGPLGGDSMIRSVEQRLRRIILNPVYGVSSNIERINELGIEFNRNGTLNFSQDKFNAVLSKGPAQVSAFLRGDGFNTGFVSVLKREIGALTNGAFGPMANRKRGIQQRITQINDRIENKERQLVRKEEALRRQFADLETKMSRLQSQGAAVGGLGQMVGGPAKQG
jgi:flagellar hook-associated protein 2